MASSSAIGPQSGVQGDDPVGYRYPIGMLYRCGTANDARIDIAIDHIQGFGRFGATEIVALRVPIRLVLGHARRDFLGDDLADLVFVFPLDTAFGLKN